MTQMSFHTGDEAGSDDNLHPEITPDSPLEPRDISAYEDLGGGLGASPQELREAATRSAGLPEGETTRVPGSSVYHYFDGHLSPDLKASGQEAVAGIKADHPPVQPAPTSIVNEEGLVRPGGSRRGISLSARRAFGGAISPEYHGYVPAELAEVSDEDKALVTPRRLNQALFAHKGPFVVSYVDPKSKVRYVALNPEEYKIIPRNVRSLGKATVAQTLAANRANPNITEVYGKAERSLDHMLEGQNESISKMIKGFKHEHSRATGLMERTKWPGLAHMDDGDMRSLMAEVWALTFSNMVRVVSMQEGWEPEIVERADKALAAYLLTGSQQERVTKWKEMLSLAKAYAKARIDLVSSRLADVSEMTS